MVISSIAIRNDTRTKSGSVLSTALPLVRCCAPLKDTNSARVSNVNFGSHTQKHSVFHDPHGIVKFHGTGLECIDRIEKTIKNVVATVRDVRRSFCR